jgi:hypothetical protein
MKSFLVLVFAIAFIFSSAWADDKPSQEELDRLLAPIALYPDDLLAQTLMASTYPLEVVEAARWREQNKALKDKALEDALQKQSWDPSVKSLTSTPDVLKRLNDNLEWTQKLGNAFLADQKGVMDTVQALRKKALDAGNLKSSEQMTVKSDSSESPTTIIIQSPQPQVVYVPTYNPTVVYGTWWYPYPPYYIYPPAYVYPPGFGFTMGIFVGAAFWGGCNWHHSSVNINVNHYNSYNHTNITNNSWNHNSQHRKGVAYPNNEVAQKFNRTSDRQAIENREAFRGKVDKGDYSSFKDKDMSGMRDKAGSVDRTNIQERASSADRSNLQNKTHNIDRSQFSGSRDNSLSNIGNSGRINSASQRGSISRSHMGSASHSGGAMKGRR